MVQLVKLTKIIQTCFKKTK